MIFRIFDLDTQQFLMDENGDIRDWPSYETAKIYADANLNSFEIYHFYLWSEKV